MTQSTKKIDKELPFSASTAFGGGAVVELVVVDVIVVVGTSMIITLVSVTLLCVRFVSVDGFGTLSKLMVTFVACTAGDDGSETSAMTFAKSRRKTQGAKIL